MSSGIRISENALGVYKSLQTKKAGNKWISFYIPSLASENDKRTKPMPQVVQENKGQPWHKDTEVQVWELGEGFESLKASLDDSAENRYVVFDVDDFEGQNGQKINAGLVLFISNRDDYRIKTKMVYASTFEAVKTALSGVKKVMNVDTADDFTLATLQDLFK